MTKYKAKKVVIDGILFDSKAEAARYGQLRLLERAGEIRNLEIHPKFPITINGEKVCTYVADFAYFTANERVVEDVKSKPTKTPVYRLKRKLVTALYPGVEIIEVGL